MLITFNHFDIPATELIFLEIVNTFLFRLIKKKKTDSLFMYESETK